MNIPPETTSAIVLLANKDLLNKLLGPTAEYLGEELKRSVERKHRNVARILEVARRRLGPKIDEAGAVPPRVLKDVVMEGSFVEDELMIEYFGGILASSRSSTGRDDRAASLLNLASRLSNYQVRAHYIIYRQIRSETRIHFQAGKRIPMPGDFRMTRDEFARAMEFTDEEIERYDVLTEHTILGLVREDLIADGTIRGGPTARHSVMGIELFLWAHGRGDALSDAFFDESVDLGAPVKIPGMD